MPPSSTPRKHTFTSMSIAVPPVFAR
jgi:hypothetical protein